MSDVHIRVDQEQWDWYLRVFCAIATRDRNGGKEGEKGERETGRER